MNNGCRTFNRPWLSQIAANLLCSLRHPASQSRVFEDGERFSGNPFWVSIFLEQFGHQPFSCNEIDHSDVVHSNEHSSNPVRQLRNSVYDHHGPSEDSPFQGG